MDSSTLKTLHRHLEIASSLVDLILTITLEDRENFLRYFVRLFKVSVTSLKFRVSMRTSLLRENELLSSIIYVVTTENFLADNFDNLLEITTEQFAIAVEISYGICYIAIYLFISYKIASCIYR